MLAKIPRVVAVPLGILASLSTIVMMLGVSAEVIYRNISGKSIPGVLELSESALVATVFLGLAYAGVTGSHIAVDLLVDRLPAALARVLVAIAWILSAGTLMWFTYATFTRATAAFAKGESRMGLLEWPLWPARWIIVIGFVAFLLIAIANVVRLLTGRPLLGESEDDQL